MKRSWNARVSPWDGDNVMNNILVISPHPDDESIGCGGTVRKHVLEGGNVEVVFLTSGEKGVKGAAPEKTSKIREQEAQASLKILGVTKSEFWREPDGSMEVKEDLILRLQQKIETQQTALIYVPHEMEDHPDHKAAALLVKKAVAKLDHHTVKPVVWMYEVWTPIQKIEHIVDISAYVDVKRRAIQAHKCQCAIMKFDEAILGLNRYRGEMHSWPGGDYAEIFTGMR
jgi:LmbE family N-acetylglucosaminyl deacetylase